MRMPVFVSLALALSLGSTAYAQAPATPEKPAATKATRNVSGTVRTATGDTVVVAGRDKGKDAEWTFAVDSKTKIKKGGKDVMAADLKAGDAVQVKYMEHGGKAVAQTITVKGGGVAKTDDKKPASSADKK